MLWYTNQRCVILWLFTARHKRFRRCQSWQSAAYARRALPLVTMFLTLTERPTEPGSLTSELLRSLWTASIRPWTFVPVVSVPFVPAEFPFKLLKEARSNPRFCNIIRYYEKIRCVGRSLPSAETITQRPRLFCNWFAAVLFAFRTGIIPLRYALYYAPR